MLLLVLSHDDGGKVQQLPNWLKDLRLRHQQHCDDDDYCREERSQANRQPELFDDLVGDQLAREVLEAFVAFLQLVQAAEHKTNLRVGVVGRAVLLKCAIFFEVITELVQQYVVLATNNVVLRIDPARRRTAWIDEEVGHEICTVVAKAIWRSIVFDGRIRTIEAFRDEVNQAVS